MKIHTPINHTNQQILDATYNCELSGWELVTLAILARACAAGDPNSSLRKHCDSFAYEVKESFYHLVVTGDQVGNINGCLRFKDSSINTLLSAK